MPQPIALLTMSVYKMIVVITVSLVYLLVDNLAMSAIYFGWGDI